MTLIVHHEMIYRVLIKLIVNETNIYPVESGMEVFMKKRFLCLVVMLVVVLMLSFFTGCGESDTQTDSDSSITKTMVLEAFTDRSAESGTETNYIAAYGCSRSDISGIGSKSLTITNGNQYDLAKLAGYLKSRHFYVGNSNDDLGEFYDPMYNTSIVQFGTGALILPSGASLNGTYTGKMGSHTKRFDFGQTSYMQRIHENDVRTGSGGSVLNVSAGDTITIANQNNPSYRYYAVIYNRIIDGSTVENIWASHDIRNIDYVNTNKYADFIANSTAAPHNGEVRFIIPAGVLRPEESMGVRIIAVNSTHLESDTSGDFSTLVIPKSTLLLYYRAQ